ncbi:hypothetical protein Taro_028373 [Colocasia esculenta]|uniref:Uncharacterized protein n=1 Tax=Colocasia esculenta TaxID=4460 RepID=A0A843VKW8_COLES|nr:hypothetical protein [Colocasia esculenta]
MLISQTMATRGRRGVGPSRGDESAGGSQAPTQQAQDKTGVPLPPPPPPVDYGALTHGLVHAMQTQAQTTAALQAQAPAHEAVFGGVPMMERFRRMTPPFFKGESDPILAESWLWETEKIFHAIRCAEDEKQRVVAPARVAAPTPGVGAVVEKPVCTQCGKRHGGEVCWVTSGRFLRCGDKNRKIRDCSKMTQQTAVETATTVARPAPRAAGRLRAQARVFAFATYEAELVEHRKRAEKRQFCAGSCGLEDSGPRWCVQLRDQELIQEEDPRLEADWSS